MSYLKGEKVGRKFDVTPDSRTASREFYVISEAKTEDGPDILATTGIPAVGDIHPRASSLVALEYSAEQDSDCWWKWTVTVNYARPDQDDSDENPLLRDPEISYSTESIFVAATYGVNQSTGNPEGAAASSAGEPFDPPPENEIEIQLINIRRFEAAAFSVSTYYGYQNAANSNSFTFGDLTIAAGLCKLRATIGPTQEYIDASDVVTAYREVNYTLAVNPLGWDHRLLDQGTYYLDSGDPVKFLDKHGEPFIGLLDGSGGKLSSGSPAVFLTLPAKKRLSFVPLSLPAGP